MEDQMKTERRKLNKVEDDPEDQERWKQATS